MKSNALLITSLLSFLFSTAQKVIVEDTYEKGNKPVGYTFLPKSKRIIIYKGKKIGGLVAGSQTNSIYSYDLNGEKKVIAENEILYECQFSHSENTLRVYDISDGIFKTKEKFLIDGKFGRLFDADLTNAFTRYFPHYDNFTDQAILKLTNQYNQQDVDYEKDNLKLDITDFITRKHKSFKLDKPNVARLTANNLVQPSKKVGLKAYINSDDSFYFITKSITADYTKSTTYKSTYSTIDGKLIKEVPFEIDLKDKALVYSNNGGGFTDTPPNKAVAFFDDDLSINNFITDSNGDVYFYGLYSDKASDLNKDAHPKGYYIFKFDKDGKKLWESINKIEDKDFNDKHYMYFTETDLSIINDELCFYAFVNENAEFLNYGILNKDTGIQEKTKKIVFHEYMSRVGVGSDFFKLNFEYKDIKELKNKKFNVNGIIAYDYNSKYADYVKNVKIKGETHFLTLFTSLGMVVIETDNEDYYKVLLFKD
jgi:hypothetical protein